jgi:peptidoglycan hydrolase-like protein with peptidoglycan-binding domain
MGSCYGKWSCDYAESQIGYTEGPNNWNKYADELDSINYYEGCGRKQNLPWCCSFVNACILHGCTTNTDPKWTAYYMMYQRTPNLSAVVSYMADYFKDNGAYFTDTQALERGDIVFFQNDDGLCHVGICVAWDNNGFTTVEGNKGDQVEKCYYKFSEVGGYVAGFGKPRYDAWEPDEEPTPEPVDDTVIVELPVLYKGIDAKGEVLTIQALLKGFGFTSDDFAIDGIFGESTRQAVMNYQRARDLEVCGVVNAETWNRILK